MLESASANRKSEQAGTTANAASNAANAADTKATQAVATANAANRTAQDANRKSEQAVTAANAAIGAANAAGTKATQATATANAARTTANAAKSLKPAVDYNNCKEVPHRALSALDAVQGTWIYQCPTGMVNVASKFASNKCCSLKHV